MRAVAVVPIYSDGEISGILEVFSRAPGIFADQHLQRLQQLANWIGSAANTPCREPIGGSNVGVQVNSHPDITLLVELELPYQTFFRNLADLVSLRSPVRLARSSSQLHGWNDVLVDSGVPWRRLLESVFLHIVVVGMLAGLSEIWPRELLLPPDRFTKHTSRTILSLSLFPRARVVARHSVPGDSKRDSGLRLQYCRRPILAKLPLARLICPILPSFHLLRLSAAVLDCTE
jgi:hypothetical protein